MLYADSDSALGLPLLKVRDRELINHVGWCTYIYQIPSCMPVLNRGHNMAHLTVSTLLLQGTEKYVSDLELHVLEDCSHFVQQDRPDEVNRLMRAWLARHNA